MVSKWSRGLCVRGLTALFAALGLAAGAGAVTVNLSPIVRVAGDGSAGGGHVGQFSSFKHDAGGGQHVAYYDVQEGNLKYAHRGSVTQDWFIEVLDADGDVGKYCSLDVGPLRTIVQTASIAPASDIVQFTSASLARAAYVGGTVELNSDGNLRTIVGIDTEANTLRLAAPYAGPALTDVTATLRWYQAAIAYQADAGVASATKVARPLGNGGWSIDTVFPAGGLTNGFFGGYYNALAIDSTGMIAVAWQDRTPVGTQVGRLGYARFTSSWTFENPDSTLQRGSEAQMVFDQNNRPVISYRDDVSGKLRSTVREIAGAWISRSLENGSGRFNALSTTYFPAGDKVFTAYQQTPAYETEPVDVRLATGDEFLIVNRNWHTQPVANGPGWGGYTGVAHGPTTATAHVTFYDAVEDRLMGTRNNGSPSLWTAPVTLDRGVDVGRFCSSSMLPPALTQLYTTYYDANGGALKLSLWDGATTSTSFIDGVKVGMSSDIGFTSDSVVVAYHNESEGSLRVATWPRGSSPEDPLFTDVVVDASSGDVGESVRMAIDGYGRIFLVYYDRENTNLRLAAFYENTWFTRHLAGEELPGDIAVDVGEYCDIAVSRDSSRIGIVYYNGSQQSLYYGITALPAPTPVLNLPFSVQNAGAGPKTGRFCSAVFSSGGSDLLAAFYDETNLRPVFGQLGSGYSIEPIEDALLDGSGWFPSIALDPQDQQPAVAYYDFSNAELKYAKRTGVNDWTVEVVDAAPDAGLYPQLVFDPTSTRRYILYHDAGDSELKLAVQTASAAWWVPGITLAEGHEGTRPSAIIDPATGLLTFAFYDDASGDLFVTATDTIPNVSNARPGWQAYR